MTPFECASEAEFGADDYERAARAHHFRGLLSAKNNLTGGAEVEFGLAAEYAGRAASCLRVVRLLRDGHVYAPVVKKGLFLCKANGQRRKYRATDEAEATFKMSKRLGVSHGSVRVDVICIEETQRRTT